MLGFLFLFFGVISTKPSPIFTDVLIGTHGPYRFLVDTGSETSFIEPQLAAQIHLQPEFRVEVATQQGSALAPGLKTHNLRLGQTVLPETELIFSDVGEARKLDPSIRGILGANALTSFNFTLSTTAGSLDVLAERPQGEVVPFYRIEGRIALKAQMDKESLTLILDSGSSHVVLFRTPAAMAKTPAVSAAFTTLEGARTVVPTLWTANMSLTNRFRIGMLPAAIVKRPGQQADGLIPASVFKKIYVDRSRGELVLVR